MKSLNIIFLFFFLNGCTSKSFYRIWGPTDYAPPPEAIKYKDLNLRYVKNHPKARATFKYKEKDYFYGVAKEKLTFKGVPIPLFSLFYFIKNGDLIAIEFSSKVRYKGRLFERDIYCFKPPNILTKIRSNFLLKPCDY